MFPKNSSGIIGVILSSSAYCLLLTWLSCFRCPCISRSFPEGQEISPSFQSCSFPHILLATGLDMQLIFGRTYVGKIDSIECRQSSRKTSKWDDLYHIDTMVFLYVTPEGKNTTREIVLGNCKDSSYSRRLRAPGLNESFEGSFDKNPFYEKCRTRQGHAHAAVFKGAEISLAGAG